MKSKKVCKMEETTMVTSEATVQQKPNEKMQLQGIDLSEFTPNPSDMTILIKRKPTVIPVGRPNNQQWFQIHPEWEYTLNTIKWKEENKFLIVQRSALSSCMDFVKPMKFFVGILTSGSIFLFPVPVEQPDEKGRAMIAEGPLHRRFPNRFLTNEEIIDVLKLNLGLDDVYIFKSRKYLRHHNNIQ